MKRDALNEPRTGKSGTSVTIVKWDVKTIFKWDVMDLLRCKPYTDKTTPLFRSLELYFT